MEGSVPVPIPVNDSPELEYEDPADLSTSIAKLRSLLQQRTAESPPIAAEVWWSGVEEMRGRTQHGGRHVDTATLAVFDEWKLLDEYDSNADRSPPHGQDTMQRLDKLFQRTVTGVFNSLRTAVGAEGEEAGGGAALPAPHHWTYVCTPVESSVGGAVARLVGARRAHAHVDAALDSLEHLAPTPQKLQPLDDFEEDVCVGGRLWCGAADAAAAARLWRSHVTHRLATLLLAGEDTYTVIRDIVRCSVPPLTHIKKLVNKRNSYIIYGEKERWIVFSKTATTL
ncbi:hypothetical protein EVAR_87120_1 [Eumeta japonica]|uniref:Uncharacterized protein n=1 Tax=Eumeta variegata TaxID=151549 RepID=A0A4C1VWH3_EUMVA|nr:hypothetical protein EVAR_87120_1 [Eumeta japonica]